MLVTLAYDWILKRRGGFCGVAFKEFNTRASNGEYPDVLGFRSCGNSVLIEVKSSRADFLCDKRKPFRKNPDFGMGTYRFYMCPWGLIKPADLPQGWGLIWVDHTLKPKIVINPYCKTLTGNIWTDGLVKNFRAENELMYSALRRLHIRGHIEEIYEIK